MSLPGHPKGEYRRAPQGVGPVTPPERRDPPFPGGAATIEATLFALLAARRAGATLCPSEVARAVAADGESWRELMPRVREVAQGLARSGRLRVTRGGVEVDATIPGGPIRLGRPVGGENP